MRVVPQRLFGLKTVTTLLTDGKSCILHKKLSKPTFNQESYVSTHVTSVVLNGIQRIKTYDGRVYNIGKNELIFLPRGIYTVSDLIPDNSHFECLLFYFDDVIAQDFLQNAQFNPQQLVKNTSFFNVSQSPSIQIYLNAFQQLVTLFPKSNTSFLNIKLHEFLHLLALDHSRFKSYLFQANLPTKRNLTTFMQANFDKPLKVEDYAYLTGRSLSSFRRDFKTLFQVTPQQWLKDKKLEKAYQLLSLQNQNVTQVALEIGYENVSYFIKSFKQKYHLSPKQFLLQKQAEQLVG